ncbi:glycosyltransferase family 2 protein [Wielerella bovis]|uniref:glycosyltransferase family 2 protein n=1 Tax=Wielerella bovis TaxID=2917790 RepID=UPI002019B1F3|nr:glycosyltransferase family 2 protein [Wielerella bovis]ULJ65052.1 glycosyltransferase [Wielerella bovis]ULJ67325.1 glycosyltransferase [Wielerella bovis]ULJ69629.1 glycosyltransferase [Wielerella bovis]
MKFCVILPVYNAETYLLDCLQSLSNQTFMDFCIVAVNDGSTDTSGEILERYARHEKRLRVYHRAENGGEAAAVNTAMDITRLMHVDYVARMDADDICLETRFEEQIEYLDKHPDITVLGTAMYLYKNFGEGSEIATPPADDADIKVRLFHAAGNLYNPTTMWRHDWFVQHQIHYTESMRVAGDFDMWIQCALQGAKFANLQKPLLHYRIHASQLTAQNTDALNTAVQISLQKLVARLFPNLTEKEVGDLTAICHGFGNYTLSLEQAKHGIAIAQRVQSETQTILGENRASLLAYLLHRATIWQNLLPKNSFSG